MRTTIFFVLQLVTISLSPGFRLAFNGLKNLYIELLGPLPEFTKPVINFHQNLAAKIVKEYPQFGEYVYRKMHNIVVYVHTIVNDRNDGLSMLEIFSKVYNGKLRPTENIPKLFTDFLAKLKKNLCEESSEFGESLYKKTEDFFNDLATILRNADGLTQLEILEKIYEELQPQYWTSINEDLRRLPGPIQKKFIKALLDTEDKNFHLLTNLDSEQKEMLKKKLDSVKW